jgi:hypothetical protein
VNGLYTIQLAGGFSSRSAGVPSPDDRVLYLLSDWDLWEPTAGVELLIMIISLFELFISPRVSSWSRRFGLPKEPTSPESEELSSDFSSLLK